MYDLRIIWHKNNMLTSKQLLKNDMIPLLSNCDQLRCLTHLNGIIEVKTTMGT